MATPRKISTHTPLARRDLFFCFIYFIFHNFYSHASCEARLPLRSCSLPARSFLLTRLLRGATFTCSTYPSDRPFLLTRLLRGATSPTKRNGMPTSFLLTRLLRGATTGTYGTIMKMWISTHTPLARRDDYKEFYEWFGIDFYSHASCEARLKRL